MYRGRLIYGVTEIDVHFDREVHCLPGKNVLIYRPFRMSIPNDIAIEYDDNPALFEDVEDNYQLQLQELAKQTDEHDNESLLISA